MSKRTLIALIAIILTGGAVAAVPYVENHTHTEFNEMVVGHSGRTDSRGGHNCSDASKRKGLCSGYHYH